MSDDSEQGESLERRELLGHLESISSLLDTPHTVKSPSANAEIPVLLDVVDIPQLERPASTSRPPSEAVAQSPESSTGPGRQELHDVMEIEAARIAEELMDEFLPIIEARFRERLEVRQRELVRSSIQSPR